MDHGLHLRSERLGAHCGPAAAGAVTARVSGQREGAQRVCLNEGALSAPGQRAADPRRLRCAPARATRRADRGQCASTRRSWRGSACCSRRRAAAARVRGVRGRRARAHAPVPVPVPVADCLHHVRHGRRVHPADRDARADRAAADPAAGRRGQQVWASKACRRQVPRALRPVAPPARRRAVPARSPSADRAGLRGLAVLVAHLAGGRAVEVVAVRRGDQRLQVRRGGGVAMQEGRQRPPRE